jgi:hypothetical protein
VPTQLLGGTKRPEYRRTARAEFEHVLPHHRHVTLTGLSHLAPDDSGDPERVGEELKKFYHRT